MKKKILEKWEKNGARNAAENYTQEGKTCALSGSFVQTSPHVTSPYESPGPPPKLPTTPYHSVPNSSYQLLIDHSLSGTNSLYRTNVVLHPKHIFGNRIIQIISVKPCMDTNIHTYQYNHHFAL